MMVPDPAPLNRQPGETAARIEALAPAAAAERRLVDAVLSRDRKAAAEFVSIYTDAVYAYVRHRLAPRLDRVDDIVQEVFLAALAGLRGFSGTAPLRVWLLGIARHKIEDFYRQLLREPDTLDEPGQSAEPPADQPLAIEERIDRARAAAKARRILAMLPETYGAVLLWRYWENRSVREIAQSSGKTEKAVERLLARARTRFRELWAEVTHG